MLARLSLWLKDGGAAVSMLGNAAPLLGGVVFPIALLPLAWELGLVIAMGVVLPLAG